MVNEKLVNTRWRRPDCRTGFGYTVIGIANIKHTGDEDVPEVVYRGDNDDWWCIPLSEWPGSLVPMEEDKEG